MLFPTTKVPEPRHVNDPLHVFVWLENASTAVMQVSSKDRTGLLANLLKNIAVMSGNFQVEAASVTTLENFAFLNLLVRRFNEGGTSRVCLTDGDRHLLEMLAVVRSEGWRVAPGQVIEMKVEGCDRPNLLRDLCLALAQQKINIHSFAMYPSVDLVEEGDQLVSKGPLCDFRFTVALPHGNDLSERSLQEMIQKINSDLEVTFNPL